MRLSPDQSMLALGGYDDRLRLLNTLTWQVIDSVECKSSQLPYEVDTWKETDGPQPCNYPSYHNSP